MKVPPRSRWTTALVLAGLAATWPAEPATGQGVRGRVLDEGTGSAVAAAEVTLVDSTGAVRVRGATDGGGVFEVRAPGAGDYELRVQRIGYLPFASRALALGRDETLHVEVRLGVDALPIEPLIVTAVSRPPGGRAAEFHERRQDPAYAGGVFLTRSDTETSVSPRTTDLLLRVPTLVIAPVASSSPGMFRYVVRVQGSGRGDLSGACTPDIFLDGVPAPRQSEQFTVDDLVDPSMLEGVEVYARAASAPLAYTSTSACGVVLFWTRSAEGQGEWSWKRLAAGGLGVAMLLVVALR